LVKEIETERVIKALLAAGFSREREQHVKLFLANFTRVAGRMW